jgi:polyketide cyclase/dehydrase/lipid transport protein
MARYTATLDTPRERHDVAAYLSDFSTTQEWDPGVVEAQRLDDGPVGLGSRFRVVARFLGRRAELTYEIVRRDADALVTLRGENATVVSLDTMRFSDTPEGGTRVSYEADLSLKGPLRVLDPLLAVAFNRVGDRATAGLRAKLTSATAASRPVEARP